MPRDPQKPQFFRTLRVKNVQQVGVLAAVLGVLARHGASVGDILSVHQSRTSMVRDIDLLVESLDELDAIIAELEEMPETTVLELRDEVLSAHVGGKIRVVSQMPIDTFAVVGELMSTWNRADAMEFAAIMVDHIVPHYRLLIESYDKAQSVQRDGHETKLELLKTGNGPKAAKAGQRGMQPAGMKR